jgi:hypothetical protein
LEGFPEINPNATGIDVGNAQHYVAVPSGRDSEPVRAFCFTADLHALADWLHQCRIKTVAMEFTGVYWVALHEILESRGFDVCLVNARQAKNLRGRDTDVKDCQWVAAVPCVWVADQIVPATERDQFATVSQASRKRQCRRQEPAYSACKRPSRR